MKCPKCGSDNFYRLDTESKSDLGQCQLDSCRFSASEQYVIGYWAGREAGIANIPVAVDPVKEKLPKIAYLKSMAWAVPVDGITSVHISHTSPKPFLFFNRFSGSVGVEITYKDREISTMVSGLSGKDFDKTVDEVKDDVETTLIKELR